MITRILLNSTVRKRMLQFHGGCDKEVDFEVLSVRGHEAISKLFQFDIEIAVRSEIDSVAMLTEKAVLGLRHGISTTGGRGRHTLKITGILSSLEQTEHDLGEYTTYRATLVPKVWRLTLETRNRLFLKKTVPEILEQVLGEAGLARGTDFDVFCSGRGYASRDYVSQYEESDFDFLSRLMENEGIFYFFAHTDEGTKMVITDTVFACPTIEGNSWIDWKPVPAEEWEKGVTRSFDQWYAADGAVVGLACRQRVIPSKVVLGDYNFRNPGNPIECEKPAGTEAAFGTAYEFGSHFKDSREGETLAEIRAQELTCRRKVFCGKSDVPALRAGGRFTLRGHKCRDHNIEYLLTEVRHEGRQWASDEFGAASATYRNEFVAIPADVPFRPERVTRKPKIAGTVNAKVAVGGSYADVDADGHYVVQLAYDREKLASKRVRMAQPYGGPDMGIHAPLHKDVEVALGFTNGDPDRPVILGSLPDPKNRSVVDAGNHTCCVFKSGGNNELRFEDTEGSEQIYLHGRKDWRIVVENDKDQTVRHDEKLEVGNNRVKKVGADQSEEIGNDKSIRVGAGHTEEIGADMSLSVGANRSSSVGGDDRESVGGSRTLTVVAMSAETVGVAKALTVGAAYTVTVGAALLETVAGDKAQTIGGSKIVSVGGSHQLAIGENLTEAITGNHSETTGKDYSLVVKKNLAVEAKESITLRSGKASITLQKDGTILIEGKNIQIKGSGEIKAEASKDVTIKGKNVLEN